MEKAIKLAIEGGWRPAEMKATQIFDVEGNWAGSHLVKNTSESEMLLDPLFWQALGKSLGWVDSLEVIENQSTGEPEEIISESWKIQWHDFIDYLADGGSPDKFFEELLTNSPPVGIFTGR